MERTGRNKTPRGLTAAKLSVLLIALVMVLAPLSVPAQYNDGDGEQAGNESGDQDDQPPAQEEGNATEEPAANVTAPAVEDLNVTDGLQVERLATGLNYPTSIAWDDNGTIYAALSGFVYGIEEPQPGQVLQQQPNGSWTTIADGFDPPVNDITWHEGDLYVSARGSIVRLDGDANWSNETLVDGLPSFGDHHNNEIVFGPDGRLYFGQGTTTNSAVVGLDNLAWPANLTTGHDLPCEDITLTGVNYVTDNPFEEGTALNGTERVYYNRSEEVPDEAQGVEGDTVTTGPYQTFGNASFQGAVIEGEVPCSGAILSMEPNGTDLDWYAWGLRNPFGLKFDDAGQLWVSENQLDARGSRPVANVLDYFWSVDEGQWYGWPDYVGGVAIDQPLFAPPGEPVPDLVLRDHPTQDPPDPSVNLPEHSAATKFDLAPIEDWGEPDTVYMALFGDMAPVTGTVDEPTGMSVVRFNASGDETFETVLSQEGGPTGAFRPVEAAFGADDRLYVVHIGSVIVDGEPPATPVPSPNTGAIYVLSPSENVTEEDGEAPTGNETPEPDPDRDAEDGLVDDELSGVDNETDDTDNDTDGEAPVEGPEDTPALGALLVLALVAAVAALAARRKA